MGFIGLIGLIGSIGFIGFIGLIGLIGLIGFRETCVFKQGSLNEFVAHLRNTYKR